MWASKNNPNFHVSYSLFENKESCYTLASWVDMDHDECSPDLKFVGGRPFDLDATETAEFWVLVKDAQTHIEKELHKIEV